VVALAIGLLVGAERERRKRRTGSHRMAGVRTFALTALLGAAAAQVGTGWTLMAGGFVVAGALAAYFRGEQEERDLTGEVALVAVYTLGALAHTAPILALECGVAIAALLAYRVQIHRLVGESLSEQELLDGMAFAIAAACVLPLLPNRALDPFGVFNPFTLWRLVVTVMGLSGLGYVAQRLAGARYGLVAAGLAGGLVSATAAVAAMGQRSRAEGAAGASAGGALAALFSSLCYMMVLIAAVSPRLLAGLLPSLAAAALTTLAYAWLLARRDRTATPGARAPGRAFDLGQAILFTVLVAAVTVVSRALQGWLGDAGALTGAAVVGLADAHAAAASMATLADAGQVAPPTATLGVLLGLTTNLLVKAPVAFGAGSRPYAWRVALGLILLLGAVWGGWAATAVLAGAAR
jgi:uncharacterized membrane protein (DUF4010 family)